MTTQQQGVSPGGSHVTHDNNVVTPKVSVTALSSSKQAEESSDRLERLIGRLEHVMEQQPKQTGLVNRTNGQPHLNQMNKPKPVVSCDICGDTEHSTYNHCRINHLCFVCFAPDHTRAECPRTVATRSKGPKLTAQCEGN